MYVCIYKALTTHSMDWSVRLRPWNEVWVTYYVYMCACTYIHAYIQTHTQHLHTSLTHDVYVCMYVWIYHVYTDIFAYTYTFVDAHMYITMHAIPDTSIHIYEFVMCGSCRTSMHMCVDTHIFTHSSFACIYMPLMLNLSAIHKANMHIYIHPCIHTYIQKYHMIDRHIQARYIYIYIYIQLYKHILTFTKINTYNCAITYT